MTGVQTCALPISDQEGGDGSKRQAEAEGSEDREPGFREPAQEAAGEKQQETGVTEEKEEEEAKERREEPETGTAMARLGRLGARVIPVQKVPEEPASFGQSEEGASSQKKTAELQKQRELLTPAQDRAAAAGTVSESVPEPVPEEPTVVFQLNGSPLRLPKKEDGRPYYLMDLIQYSGIDLDHPKGTVTLKVNGESGRFQQVLRPGDIIEIGEEERR